MIGLDTETQDGRCILICTPENFHLAGGFSGIVNWLLKQGSEFIAWNLTYDAQAIFSWLEPRQQWELARLGTTGVRGYYHSRAPSGGEFLVQWIPGKELYVKRGRYGKHLRIFDAYQFYGASLEVASQKYFGEGKQKLAGIDIENMAQALRERKEDVIRYCQQDARLAQILWERVQSPLEEIGAKTDRPLSPAYIAGHFFMRKHKRPSKKINDVFRRCYHGGRVELLRRGTFQDVSYYDINSAYPYWAAQLPDMRDLQVVIGSTPSADAVMGAYHVAISADASHHIGPVPVPHGVLVYPVGTFRTWVDRYTLESLEAQEYLADVSECVEFHPRPHISAPRLAFPAIPEMYALRKSRPELNLAIKLLLNGLYGKTAQTTHLWKIVHTLEECDLEEEGEYLQSVHRPGWYQNFAYASHITGGSRMQLYRAMLQRPESTIMAATDAIWTEFPIDLPLGQGLGEWKYEKISRMLAIMCGVYAELLAGKNNWRSWFRGFRTKESLITALRLDPEKSSLEVTCQLPITMLWSLKHDMPINLIDTYERQLNLNSDGKRYWPENLCANQLLSGNQSSEPYLVEEE